MVFINFLMLVFVCSVTHVGGLLAPRTDNVVEEEGNDAIAGFSFDNVAGYTGFTGDVPVTTENNTAISTGGVAISGQRLVQDSFDDIDADVTIDSTDNVAVSNQTAIAGRQLVIGSLTDSEVDEQVTVTDNNATVVGSMVNGEGLPVAIAGNQEQISNLESSAFTQNNLAQNNTAINENEGKAIGGLQTSFGSVTESFVQSDNAAVDNIASAEKGAAIAGVQSNFATVNDSTIEATSEAKYNQAYSKEGNAVAGSSNNFGVIEATFPVGGVEVDINATASRNIAKAQDDGKAISGVEVNVASATRADIDVDAVATQNLAVVEGESDRPRNAVSGFQGNFGILDDVSLDIDVTTNNNTAFNNHTDTGANSANNAIAGSSTVINELKDSIVKIDTNSTENYAYAINGDAIAGDRVLVVESDADSNVVLDLYAKDNEAVSVNKNAVLDNNVNIGGDASVFDP